MCVRVKGKKDFNLNSDFTIWQGDYGLTETANLQRKMHLGSEGDDFSLEPMLHLGCV